MTINSSLSWENFRSTVFVPGEKRVHRVSENPFIEIYGDGVDNRIGILFEVPTPIIPSLALSRLALIATRFVRYGERTFLDISTTALALHRQFYHFSVAAAERVLFDSCSPVDAAELEAACFGDLLQVEALLSPERQIGLLGELLFLELLIAYHGTRALDAWIGPRGEPHDFRFEKYEFEVKTTLATRRVHTINGSEQLIPSAGCSLFLTSVMLGPVGAEAGFSLAGKINGLDNLFGSEPSRSAAFASALEASGVRKPDVQHYNRAFGMRRPMGVIPVDASCPAISRPMIQKVLGPLAARVGNVRYEVDVDGLEMEVGTASCEAILSASGVRGGVL